MVFLPLMETVTVFFTPPFTPSSEVALWARVMEESLPVTSLTTEAISALSSFMKSLAETSDSETDSSRE